MEVKKTYGVIGSNTDNISVIKLWDNGIIFIKLEDNAHIKYKDSKKQFEFPKSKYDGINKRLILQETGRYIFISKEAQGFSARFETHIYTKGSIVIIKSLARAASSSISPDSKQ